MPDGTTYARGRRARAERRRAEKAEKRRLEEGLALEEAGTPLDDLTDAALETVIGSGLSSLNGLSHDRRSEAAHVSRDATEDLGEGQTEIGLVAGSQRGGELTVLIESGACQARLSRELLQRQAAVTVGDRVQMAQGNDGRRTVVGIEPRRTRLARIREDRSRRSEFSREEAVLAANVDVAVIVAAVAQPRFHPKLVDRFLVICQYGGIEPVLCLNKCDLVDSPPDVSIYEQIGLPIVYTSAATGDGLDELRQRLRGRIAVFTGHSGVGKSSLVNVLLGDALQVVGAVRGADGRGRHTTTWSTLLRWDEASFVVDTPGVRSLGVWKIEPSTLAWYFPEIAAAGSACRFTGCSHTHEPDCAVKEAVESGAIPRQRYESFVRMLDG